MLYNLSLEKPPSDKATATSETYKINDYLPQMIIRMDTNPTARFSTSIKFIRLSVWKAPQI